VTEFPGHCFFFIIIYKLVALLWLPRCEAIRTAGKWCVAFNISSGHFRDLVPFLLTFHHELVSAVGVAELLLSVQQRDNDTYVG
jgi:hypothetical protein